MRTVTAINCNGSKPVKKNSTDIKGKRIATPETYENGVDKQVAEIQALLAGRQMVKVQPAAVDTPNRTLWV
jgi:hypothetical protein